MEKEIKKLYKSISNPKYKIGEIVIYPYQGKRWMQSEILEAYLDLKTNRWNYLLGTWDRSKRAMTEEEFIKKITQ